MKVTALLAFALAQAVLAEPVDFSGARQLPAGCRMDEKWMLNIKSQAYEPHPVVVCPNQRYGSNFAPPRASLKAPTDDFFNTDTDPTNAVTTDSTRVGVKLVEEPQRIVQSTSTANTTAARAKDITPLDGVTLLFKCGTGVSTTMCQQGRISFTAALNRIASNLDLTQGIIVSAQFRSFCSEDNDCTKHVIGKASPSTFIPFDMPNGIRIQLPQSLAKNGRWDVDFEPSDFDIAADFNADVPFFFRGMENIPDDAVDFELIAMHEVMHGLGFTSMLNAWFKEVNGWKTSDQKYLTPNTNYNPSAMTVSSWRPMSVLDYFSTLTEEGSTLAQAAQKIMQYSSFGASTTSFVRQFESSGAPFQQATSLYTTLTSATKQVYVNLPSRQLTNGTFIIGSAYNMTLRESEANPLNDLNRVFMQTFDGKWESGSSLSHFDLDTYSKSPDFLMVPSVTHLRGLSLDQLMFAYGPSNTHGAMGPRILGMLQTFGWAVRDTPLDTGLVAQNPIRVASSFWNRRVLGMSMSVFFGVLLAILAVGMVTGSIVWRRHKAAKAKAAAARGPNKVGSGLPSPTPARPASGLAGHHPGLRGEASHLTPDQWSKYASMLAVSDGGPAKPPPAKPAHGPVLLPASSTQTLAPSASTECLFAVPPGEDARTDQPVNPFYTLPRNQRASVLQAADLHRAGSWGGPAGPKRKASVKRVSGVPDHLTNQTIETNLINMSLYNPLQSAGTDTLPREGLHERVRSNETLAEQGLSRTTSAVSLASSVHPLTGTMFLTVERYDALEMDEVSVLVGDLITLGQVFDDGWAFVKNERTGGMGLAPYEFLKGDM